MEIRDRHLVGKLLVLLPGAHRGNITFRHTDTWRLAARSALFMQLNAIEDAAFETDVNKRQELLTKAVDNIGALVMYLESAYNYSLNEAKETIADHFNPPERRVLQMGRAG